MQLKRKMYGWGCLCSLLITCLACTLPYLHLVSVVFGTAIPTSLNIFGKMFLTLGAHAQRGLRYLYSVCVCVCVCVCPTGLICGLVLVDISLKALAA